jgi:hypothetical protein
MEKTAVRDAQLKERWEALVSVLSSQFGADEAMDIEGMLYLVGLQELGQLHRCFKKDDNVNLMHIGICTILEPYGYYRFDQYDKEGWPHFELVAPLPALKPGEQRLLMKEALVDYFLEKGTIS